MPIRIACGSAVDYTDSLSNVWIADDYFTGGETFPSGDPIAGTTDDILFQNERYGDFSYSIPIANGDYTLNLGFAETFWEAPADLGNRVFDVSAQGVLILDNFEILVEAAKNTALIKSFSITVSGGSVDLVFTTVADNAKISNIEILEAPPSYSASPLGLLMTNY
jgi:hypothetical protein